MKRQLHCPLKEDIGDNDPLRLDVAARLAFPDGSMTAGGLRRLARAGKLVVERMNGRDYTTLAAIRDMREKCRVVPEDRVPGPEPRAAAHSSGTTSAVIAAAKSRLDAMLATPTKSPVDVRRSERGGPATGPRQFAPGPAGGPRRGPPVRTGGPQLRSTIQPG